LTASLEIVAILIEVIAGRARGACTQIRLAAGTDYVRRLLILVKNFEWN
jgi:hypothetical protein